jgi:hypothetical protein
MDRTFTLGQRYTRSQIHAHLGGDLRSYLPHKDGRVVAVCAKEDRNPNARQGILDSGSGGNVERWTDTLVAQGGTVPVFVYVGHAQWEFIGDWQVCGYVRSGPLLAERDRICRALIPHRIIRRVVIMEAA